MTSETWQERAATCVVGDRDPSPQILAGEKCCPATHHGWRNGGRRTWSCTLLADHMTQHVAGTGRNVVAVWSVTA